MSTHNILTAFITCPRCKQTAEMKVETFFGFGNLITYRLGDRVVWRDRKSVKKGGRPSKGNMVGIGYTLCPRCNLDFFVKVTIVDDVIKGVSPDLDKEPLIPDEHSSDL